MSTKKHQRLRKHIILCLFELADSAMSANEFVTNFCLDQSYVDDIIIELEEDGCLTAIEDEYYEITNRGRVKVTAGASRHRIGTIK